MPTSRRRRSVAVIGDVAIDWLAYPSPAKQTQHRPDPKALNWQMRAGTRMVARGGGALLLARFIEAATGTRPKSYEPPNLETSGPDQFLHSMVDLKAGRDSGRYFVDNQRGCSGPKTHNRNLKLPRFPTPSILVLDDAGNGFRAAQYAWNSIVTRADLDWIVYKMSQPLATGKLWDKVRKGVVLSDKRRKLDPERLIVVVNAEDLRNEGINLSRHVSWERTAEDFVRQLAAQGPLASLVTCANLLVRFDCDGVIHHHGRSAKPPILYFDPARSEGDFVGECEGSMVGTTSAFVAGLVGALSRAPKDIDGAIIPAMRAARAVAKAGFVIPEILGKPKSKKIDEAKYAHPDYPVGSIKTKSIKPDAGIRHIAIPSKGISDGAQDSWSILDRTNDYAVDAVALRVARYGLTKLGSAPVGNFGKLETADRQEIESFRSISNLLRQYVNDRQQVKPISIAVFGPPGAGKSFGVEEVATSIAGEQLKILKFNLSQFTRPEELISAFHLVRDQGLNGKLPLAFFDEFDVTFEQPLGWLRFLLSPMQDGEFTESGATHPIGRAIFVFAGGTRPNFAEFTHPLTLTEDDPERIAFAAAKGPDFVSRLRGHVDIMGPNPVSAEDKMYPIRRAILLRSLIRKHAKGLFREDDKTAIEDRELRIDEGVLRGLLRVSNYQHGARSLEAVLLMSRLSGKRSFERASLPPAGQLAMHVDATEFLALVAAERTPEDLRERLGPLLHQAYVAFRRQQSPNEDFSDDSSMREWNHLPEELKESNRLQADDIPRKLRAIDCYMAPTIPERKTFSISRKIERLAEMEHDRFNSERLQQQWRDGPRDVENRTSPFLRPWADLKPKIKGYDRNAVRVLPKVLKSLGYGIYKLEEA
jgi:hypothetical protein